jgi:hypothetical protein
MYAPFDKERVRQLAQAILDAVSDAPVLPIAEQRPQAQPPADERSAPEREVYTTAEVAHLLGVASSWVTKNIPAFPGAFRLSDSQRANWRFPKEGVEQFIAKRRAG